MQIGHQIQTHRQRLGLTQDQLAEKLYVSRQTISNWENDRHYPDIENLVLLSALFDTSIDQLVKGDVPQMKATNFAASTSRHVKWMIGLELAGIVAIAPALFLPRPWALLIPGGLWLLSLIPAMRLEAAKRQADVRTYAEILAYMNGEDLSELRRRRHSLRSRSQMTLIILGYALIAGLLALLASLPYLLWH